LQSRQPVGIGIATAPEFFSGIGLWYDDFAQTSDAEGRDLRAQAAYRHVATAFLRAF